MERPPGLPSIDARTPESIKNAKFLVSGMDGLVDTPTKEQQIALYNSINRKLKLARENNVDRIAKELIEVQPMDPNLISNLMEELKEMEEHEKNNRNN